MNISGNDNIYAHYTADDFLSDDFFICSVRRPSVETDDFWFRFLENNPAVSGEFFLAKRMLLSFGDDPELTLPDSEADELLQRILRANRPALPLNGKKRVRYIAGALAGAAACAAVALVMCLRPQAPVPGPMDLLSYIEKCDSIDFTEKSIKLVLSDQRTIESHEEDPDISYQQEEIKIAAEEVSKSESGELNQLIVPYGKRSRLTLSDGTRMWVNAGTAVTYPVEFKGDLREIYVTGEVFLDVVPDPSRPFIVRTNETDIRVLGTKFNVSAYRDEPQQVVLASGSVQVNLSGSDRTVVLEPDQMFLMVDGKPVRRNVDAELYTSWVRGVYIFDNEPLAAVMNRLSKYYGIKVECSPQVSGIRCSGKLNLIDSFDEILNNLSMISSIKYVSNDNEYRIF